MSPTALAFLSLLAWYLLLVLTLGGLRVFLTVTGQHPVNRFDPSGADVSPFSQRLCRTHANFYESFPLLGGILLFALAADMAQVTDPLAFVVLGARIGQSLIHLASTSPIAVQIRFAFFAVQVGIATWWLIQFLF